MSKWLLRGLVFAALMVVIRLVQGAVINAWETKALLISVTLVVIFAIVVFVWGFLDGRADARANPDPDRREDLAMTWLLAGLFAGIVSGAVAWLISLFYKNLYVGGLINELTTFAAFTALLIFMFAIAGVALGHWVIDRHAEDTPRQHTDSLRATTAPTPTCSPPYAILTRPARMRPARNRRPSVAVRTSSSPRRPLRAARREPGRVLHVRQLERADIGLGELTARGSARRFPDHRDRPAVRPQQPRRRAHAGTVLLRHADPDAGCVSVQPDHRDAGAGGGCSAGCLCDRVDAGRGLDGDARRGRDGPLRRPWLDARRPRYTGAVMFVLLPTFVVPTVVSTAICNSVASTDDR